ncbi:hypothetical protein NST21_19795 [Peribacillus sp. FSL K6-1552]|uniref:hypothetical protein n=1 Tax=Peribacillus sp. FSL K6-1552 TaxID=2954514 RepID=UPI0030F906D0
MENIIQFTIVVVIFWLEKIYKEYYKIKEFEIDNDRGNNTYSALELKPCNAQGNHQ